MREEQIKSAADAMHGPELGGIWYALGVISWLFHLWEWKRNFPRVTHPQLTAKVGVHLLARLCVSELRES